MRKALGPTLLALMLSTGLATDALAQTENQVAQEETENGGDDGSGKLGLLGLLGLAGLAGLARRDRPAAPDTRPGGGAVR